MKKYQPPILIATILIIVSMMSCSSEEQIRERERLINAHWEYHQVIGDLKGKATVPGVIHTDLFANKQIEDPFYRTNEKDLQWIDKEDWIYKTEFNISSEELAYVNTELSFEGLDTYADVYLNDKKILSSDNMFRTWNVDVKPFIKEGANKLQIHFYSPIKRGLELYEASEYAYPASNDQSENGGLDDKKVSVFTRKAGYHYGWDWGPRFVTSGIWRPVKLKMWDKVRIKDFFIKQPSVTKELAKLEAEIELNVDHDDSYLLQVINVANNKILAEKEVNTSVHNNKFTIPFTVENPKLWWCNGLGNANLYDFKIIVSKHNQTLAKKDISTGLRSLKLIREKDKDGESFLFELNGVKVFAKGANYIPNDNFLPRVTKQDYDKVIADAVDANMNMLRVWGGGVYEDDYFYKLCDEKGIMIWQDFMFACSMYPGDSLMLNSIKHEAIDNVVRLRNHPSIALWCGNNEMNTAWSYFDDEKGWGWKKEYTQEQREEIQEAYMNIFHQILPEVIDGYTDGDDYWPSSPQAGYAANQHSSYESTSGDMHYWGVWHGLHHFEDFDKYRARFMSEYGFQSFPDFETVKKYTLPEDYDIESDVMAAHQRSGIGNLRIKEYMSWYYPVPNDFEQFLYMSQMLQAQGIKMAIEAHRRAMPYCMGSLYWQINDCWPVASWSSTDYYHKWKALHYAVKKAYEPILISAPIKDEKVDLYVVSDLLKDIEGYLNVSVLDFKGDKISELNIPVTVKSNTSTQIDKIEISQLTKGRSQSELVMDIKLVENDNILSSNIFYFLYPKDLKLPEVKLNVEVSETNEKLIKIYSDNLAKGVYLNIPDQEVIFSDNYFDILPAEEKQITISGEGKFNIDSLQIMYLNKIK